MHNLVSLLSFVLAIAALLTLPRALRATAGAVKLALATRIFAITSVTLVVLMVTGVTGAAEGLAQRLFILLVYGWPVLVTATGPQKANRVATHIRWRPARG